MRPRPYPIFETRGFARAVQAGTRTRTGAPGPKYWQQWSRYRLAASYEPTTGLLEGQGTITYHNRSPESLPMVYLHLHGNLFRLYRTGTSLTNYEWTDVVTLAQGERAVLEFSYKFPGQFMFHAHQSEFAELGWSGIFRVEEPTRV